MADILITNRICDLESLDDIHDMDSFRRQYQNRPRIGPPILHPYRPYLHSAQPSAGEQNILTTLEIHGLNKDVTDMAMDLGEENTIAIAEIAAGLRDYGAAATGAATTVYARRMQGSARRSSAFRTRCSNTAPYPNPNAPPPRQPDKR